MKFEWKIFLCHDIHITITEGRGYVTEGKGKKEKPTPKKQWTWEVEFTVPNCLT